MRVRSPAARSALIASAAAIGGFLFGFDTAVINGTVTALMQEFHAGGVAIGLTVSAALIGCAIGACFAGILADRWGRVRAMIVTAAVFVVSGILSGAAHSLLELSAWRLLGGLAIGAASVVAPAYIAEIAPAHLRGRLASLQQLAIVAGIFAALLGDYALAQLAGSASQPLAFGLPAWRWMFWTEVLPALGYGIAATFIPESPRWLVVRSRDAEAREVLEWLGDARLVGPTYGWFVGALGVLYGAVGLPGIMLLAASPLLEYVLGIDNPSGRTTLLFALLLLTVAYLVNVISVQLAARVNNVAVFTEVIGTVVVAVVLFALWGTDAKPSGHGIGFLGTAQHPAGQSWWYSVLLASLIGIYTIVGFESAADMAEEAVDARRAVPRAMIGSVVVSAVLGLVVLIGFTLAIPAGPTFEEGGLPGVFEYSAARRTPGPHLHRRRRLLDVRSDRHRRSGQRPAAVRHGAGQHAARLPLAAGGQPGHPHAHSGARRLVGGLRRGDDLRLQPGERLRHPGRGDRAGALPALPAHCGRLRPQAPAARAAARCVSTSAAAGPVFVASVVWLVAVVLVLTLPEEFHSADWYVLGGSPSRRCGGVVGLRGRLARGEAGPGRTPLPEAADEARPVGA